MRESAFNSKYALYQYFIYVHFNVYSWIHLAYTPLQEALDTYKSLKCPTKKGKNLKIISKMSTKLFKKKPIIYYKRLFFFPYHPF